jgi:hypothetical protein
MRRIPGIRIAALLLTSAAAVAGCATDVMAPRSVADAYVEQLGDGLVQRVELAKREPSTGDLLGLRSVVTNHGAARDVTVRTCDLDVTGLEVAPALTCGGYSATYRMMPGDSAVVVMNATIVSRAGTYRVRVRHLLEPERWLEFTLRVR